MSYMPVFDDPHLTLSPPTSSGAAPHRIPLMKSGARRAPENIQPGAQTKYPKLAVGVIRTKVQKPALTQHIIEKEVRTPCPGLNFVIEIQRLEGLQYYCSICDAVCSSSCIIQHLNGFRHKIKSVEKFNYNAYEQLKNHPKYKIEKELQNILHKIQKVDGMGQMASEIEEFASNSPQMSCVSLPSTSRVYRDQPSTSRESNKKNQGSFEAYNQATVPDMTISDFYCPVCDLYMNSYVMWKSHIRGKRHLTNLKKKEEVPSNNKTIPLEKKESLLLKLIDNECPGEPIVGLSEIEEREIPENNLSVYQCFLCGCSHQYLGIIEHVISLKHRTKYLDKIDYPERGIIVGMSDRAAVSLVKEMCAQVEAEYGRGVPTVI